MPRAKGTEVVSLPWRLAEIVRHHQGPDTNFSRLMASLLEKVLPATNLDSVSNPETKIILADSVVEALGSARKRYEQLWAGGAYLPAADIAAVMHKLFASAPAANHVEVSTILPTRYLASLSPLLVEQSTHLSNNDALGYPRPEMTHVIAAPKEILQSERKEHKTMVDRYMQWHETNGVKLLHMEPTRLDAVIEKALERPRSKMVAYWDGRFAAELLDVNPHAVNVAFSANEQAQFDAIADYIEVLTPELPSLAPLAEVYGMGQQPK